MSKKELLNSQLWLSRGARENGANEEDNSSASEGEMTDDSHHSPPTSSAAQPTASHITHPSPPPPPPPHSSTPHCFNHLLRRQMTLDPFLSQNTFKKSCYGIHSSVRRLALERQLKEHNGCVNCINFSFDGQLLASGSDDLHVVLWDWARGKAVGKLDSGHVANVFQAKFMPHTGDSVLVTAARDGQIRCQVVSSTGAHIHSKRVAYHNDSAHKLSVVPDSSNVFLSCGEDGMVLEIDLRDEPGTRNRLLTCKSEKNGKIPLYSIHIDPSDYNYFAISGRDQYARIYDRRLLRESANGSTTVEPVKKYCPHILESPENEFKRANITCLMYSHDGKELVCSYNDDDIYLFDTSHSSGSDAIKTYKGHRNNATVKGVNFYGLNSEYIVSGSDCGHVFLWDKESEHIVQFLEGDHEGVVNCLEPHPHIPVLATSGLDHDVKIFSPTAKEPSTLTELEEVVKKNQEERDAERSMPLDGYEMFMQFIIRQYRRGIRRQIGIPDEDSDTDESDGEEDGVRNGIIIRGGDHNMEDDDSDVDEDSEEGRDNLRRCLHQ